MSSQPQKRALLIAGPTASGKSAFALRLAAEHGGIIINADAMQVYRELRLLTARPTDQDEQRAAHRLYGYVSGSENYSVARWLGDVEKELHAAWQANAVPILVGGTGLYFKALEQGLADIPPIPEEIRDKWRSFKGDLLDELSRRDSVAATNLKASDRQRLTRALEVIDATGQSLRHWQTLAQRRAALAEVVVERLFLDVPREILYARAEERFDHMIGKGAIEEVRPLIGLDADLPMMRAIGVPEICGYLLGRQTLEATVADAKMATRHYIKRQLTWWRNQMPGWVPVSSDEI